MILSVKVVRRMTLKGRLENIKVLHLEGQALSFLMRKETRDHSPVLHDGLSALRYLVAHAAHDDQLLHEVDKEEPAAHHDLGQRFHAGVQAGEALADLKLWFTHEHHLLFEPNLALLYLVDPCRI